MKEQNYPYANNFAATFYSCKGLNGNASALWERQNVTSSRILFWNVYKFIKLQPNTKHLEVIRNTVHYK